MQFSLGSLLVYRRFQSPFASHCQGRHALTGLNGLPAKSNGISQRTGRDGARRIEQAVLEGLECRRLLSTYTLSVLANFDASSGTGPEGGIVMDPQGNIYGTAGFGGATGDGTVFELPHGSNAVQALDSFNAQATGQLPVGRLLIDAGGNLYGTTSTGGAGEIGTVFDWNKAAGAIVGLAAFSAASVDGNMPRAGLIADSAGNLYGTTQNGGANNQGTLFEFVPNEGIKILASGDTLNAANLQSDLIMDSAGNLYGTSVFGGIKQSGSVFELAKGSSTFTVLASFNTANGASPQGGLVMDAAGNLYGVTTAGGANNDGTIFEVARGSGVATTLADFNGANGASADSTLLMDSAGNLFGIAATGGDAANDGTAFELIEGTSVITTLATFNSTTGTQPLGALSMDSAGNIFGATANGGANMGGTIFELSPAPASATKLAFATPVVSSGGTLSSVINVVVEDSTGNIVPSDSSAVTLALASGPPGAALGGILTATAVNGVASFTNLTLNEMGNFTLSASDPLLATPVSLPIVVTSPTSSYGLTTVAQFDGTNGADPQGGLLLDSAGNLFGSASKGGDAAGDGTLFEIAKGSNAITPLASFVLAAGGANPQGGALIEDSSGDLFGATTTGGSAGQGTVFELAVGSPFITALNSFSAATGGGSPHNALVMDAVGNFYGTWKTGGANGDGAVYSLIDAGIGINILAGFNGANGAAPQSGLITDPAGDLFGTTRYGGSNNVGTVFELAVGGSTITTLASFTTVNGAQPLSALMTDSAGNLYGTTDAGGASNDGTVFEIAQGSGVVTTLGTFNGANGKNPFYGPLLMDASGNLFGTTASGGAHNDGTVFEIASNSGVITTLYSFNVTDGGDPVGGLIADSAGNLYGTASNGGDANGDGTVFKLTPGTGIAPAPATQLAFTVPPTAAVAGATLNPAVVVTVNDSSGIPVATDSSTVTLTITSGPPGAILGGTVSMPDINGKATFSDLTLSAPGDYTLTATDGTLAPATTATFTISPAPALPAVQVAFAAIPTGAVAGDVVVPPVTVSAEDINGNLVPTDASAVTVAIASGPSGAVLGGTLTASAVNGVAMFSNLTLSLPGMYTLVATDGALTPATSVTFLVAAAPAPAQLAITSATVTAVAGAVIASPVVVSVEDAAGQVFSTDNSAVTLAIASGPAGGVLGGAVTVSAVNGVATFSNFSLSLPGTYSLTATDGTLTAATSPDITVFIPAKIGVLDPTFGFGGVASHNVGLTSTAGLVVQGDGKSVIAGTSGAAGSHAFGITRYNADGSLDTNFGTMGVTITPLPGDAQANAEVLLANGDILIAGTDTTLANGVSGTTTTGSQFALAEYTPAGFLDPTFGNGAGYVLTSFSAIANTLSNDVASALAIGRDGTIYIGGSSDANGHGLDFAVAAYTPSGAPSPAFGTNGKVLLDFLGGDDSIAALALGSNGELIAAGSAVDPSTGVSSVALAEFLHSGALDPKFGVKGKLTMNVGGVDSAASSLAIDSQGKIVLGGYAATGSASAGTLSANFLVLRYTSDGKLDKTFGNHGVVSTSFNQPAAITTVLIDPDGAIIASGKTVSSLLNFDPSTLELAVARYTAKGQLDPTFNGDGEAIYSLSGAGATPSLKTSAGYTTQSELAQSARAVPFDTTSMLLGDLKQLEMMVQGVAVTGTNGTLLAVGANGANTVEASIVTTGLDLAASIVTSVPQSVVGGAKGAATVNIAETGTDLAAGTFTIQLFASSFPYVPTGQTPFQSFPEKLKLKRGASKNEKVKFVYPASLAKGSYYLIATVSTGAARDLNIANNTSTSTSTVLIAPPFVHLAGSALSTPIFNGKKPALVSFTITNTGNVPASAEAEVEFFASTTATPTGATPVATVPLRINLKPATGHPFKVKLLLPAAVLPGTYSLVALLDPANVFHDPNAATNFIVSGNTFVVM